VRPLLLVLAFSLLFAGCGGRSDADIRRKLPGTWVKAEEEEPRGYKFRSTLEATGRFHREYSYGTNVLDEEEGTWEVMDGVLIETTTCRLTTNAPLPMSFRYRVIRIDDEELVFKQDPPAQPPGSVPKTNEVRARRVAR